MEECMDRGMEMAKNKNMNMIIFTSLFFFNYFQNSYKFINIQKIFYSVFHYIINGFPRSKSTKKRIPRKGLPFILFCKIDSPCFSNNNYLHLPRILQLLLNLLGNIMRKNHSLVFINLFRLYNDSDFTACLDSITTGYPRI